MAVTKLVNQALVLVKRDKTKFGTTAELLAGVVDMHAELVKGAGLMPQ